MPQLALGVGVPEYSFQTSAALSGGISYALPEANLVAWQTIYASAPSAVTVTLQGSMDGTNWINIDISTDVNGELRTLQTGSKFLRAFFFSQTGGGLHSVLIVCHKIIQGVLQLDDVTGNIVIPNRAQVLLNDGSLALPGLSFLSDPDLGLYRISANVMGVGGTLLTRNLARIGGVLYSSGVGSGNIGVAETILGQFSLPAGTIDLNGKGLRITYILTCAGNANAKTIQLYFGSSNYITRANTDNGFNYKIVTEIYRVGPVNQVLNTVQVLGVGGTAASVITSFNNGTQDLSTALLIKISGTSAVATNDVFLQNMLVELLN